MTVALEADLALTNVAQLAGVTDGRRAFERIDLTNRFQILDGGSIAVRGGRIVWVGLANQLPAVSRDCKIHDCGGRVVVPGLVDSHTHLIYAGDRVEEFEWRLNGASYQEIAERGGGINTTVRALRNATNAELANQTRRRLRRCLAGGVTTVEIKTGYGLNAADELRCLDVIGQLDREGPWELVPTFLGAHVVPPEFARNRAGYVRLLCEEMLPAVAASGKARFCDVFCDRGAFDIQESCEILEAARRLGMQLKLHADELTCLGGARLAVELDALSADHLLCIDQAGIDALAQSRTVATLLPGTALFLGLAFAPARKILARGIPVALATDSNPGTCPSENLLLMGSLACTQMRMAPLEALAGMTIHGAAALGLSDRLGSFEPGKQADFVVCDVRRFEQLFYEFGANHVRQVFKRGNLVFDANSARSA
jgi:imidazolonepropionase